MILQISHMFTCLVLVAASDDNPPSVLPSHELQSRIIRVHKSIHSLRIRHRTGGYSEPEYPTGTYSLVTLAAKSPDLLFHDSAKGHPGVPWQDDPHRQTAYITKDNIFNVYPLDRAFFKKSLEPNAPLPGTLQGEFFFVSTGLWPFPARESPTIGEERTPHMLIDIAKAPGGIKVRDQLVKINGHWCHVIENSTTDVLWIDAQRGCCLMRRKFFEKKTGRLMAQYELGGHEQMVAGVWIPRWVKNIHFDYMAASPDGRMRKLLDATIVIEEAAVNTIDDEREFQFTPPPGAFEYDSTDIRKPGKQVVAGGEDHLDMLCQWAVNYCDLGDQRESKSFLSPINRYWLVGLILGLVCVLETWGRIKIKNKRALGAI